MSKTKITMRQNSWHLKAGDEVEVDSAVAERLVADGHAYRSSAAAKKSSGSGSGS